MKLSEIEIIDKRIIEIFTGPMCSEKSFNLLLKIGENNETDVIIKSSINTREIGIKSRKNGLFHKSTHSTYNLIDLFKDESFFTKLKTAKSIFIDECQFFPDLYDFVNILKDYKNIYIAGLDLDSEKKPFEQVKQVFEIENVIINKLTAICDFCKEKNAIYSYCKVEKKEKIKVGGENEYGVHCENCNVK